MRHSSSIFRPYPAQLYIFGKLSVWAFQRCTVRLQQSSFRPDLPHGSSTVSILRIEGNHLPSVIIYPKSPVPCIIADLDYNCRLSLISHSHSESHDPVECIPVISNSLYCTLMNTSVTDEQNSIEENQDGKHGHVRVNCKK